jgi:hypothetical protein
MTLPKWGLILQLLTLCKGKSIPHPLQWQSGMAAQEHIINLPGEEDKELTIVLADGPFLRLSSTSFRRQLVRSSVLLDHSKVNLVSNNLKIQAKRYKGDRLLQFGQYHTRMDLNFQFAMFPQQSFTNCQSICAITGGEMPKLRQQLKDLKRLWPKELGSFWVQSTTRANIQDLYKTDYSCSFDNLTLLPKNQLSGEGSTEVFGIQENELLQLKIDDISSLVNYWSAQGTDGYWKPQAFNLWAALSSDGNKARLYVAQPQSVLLPQEYDQSCVCVQGLTPNEKSLARARHLLDISGTYLKDVPGKFEVERIKAEAPSHLSTLQNLMRSTSVTESQVFLEKNDLNDILIVNASSLARDQRAVGGIIASVFVKSALYGVTYLHNDPQAKLILKNLADEVKHSVQIEKPELNEHFADDKAFNTYLKNQMKDSGFNLSKERDQIFKFEVSHKFPMLDNMHRLSERKAGSILQLARLLSYFKNSISQEVPQLLYKQVITSLPYKVANDESKILVTIWHGKSYIVYTFFTEIVRTDLSTQELLLSSLPHVRKDGLSERFNIDLKTDGTISQKISPRCRNAALLGRSGSLKNHCQSVMARQDFLQRKLVTDKFQLVQAQTRGALLTIKCKGSQDKNEILEKDVNLILATKDCQFQIVHESAVSSLGQLTQTPASEKHQPMLVLAYNIKGENSQLTKLYLILSVTCAITIFALSMLTAVIFVVGRFLQKYKPVKVNENFETSSRDDLAITDIFRKQNDSDEEESPKKKPNEKDNSDKIGPNHIEVYL